MNIIGRNIEQKKLERLVLSRKPEFLVVYGRRRVGKTYLIKNYFKEEFSFYSTGVKNIKIKEELKIFYTALKKYSYKGSNTPKDWFEAFSMLEELLESNEVRKVTTQRKRIIFLDEIPWMDTPKSNFKSALDYFWNSYASTKENLLLIVCGSATSWILDNITSDKGGFYNRVTEKIQLLPFSLKECEDFLISNNIKWSKKTIMECYMVFGGIPYYLNLLDGNLSLHQNINDLLFIEGGSLYYEYDKLMSSLFKNHELHSQIISVLGKHHNGVLRNDLINTYKLQDGAPLTKALKELEECGFIRKYTNYFKNKNDSLFQLIDSFTLFCIEFKNKNNFNNWLSNINTPKYHNWCGYAFEILALNHIKQIKEYLGISGIESKQFAYISKLKEKGAQIDLIIDRKDDVINLCEMKYTNNNFVIDKEYCEKIQNKLNVFASESKTKSSILITFITSEKLKQNEYSNICNINIEGEDLFR